jgi:hypothetical protein
VLGGYPLARNTVSMTGILITFARGGRDYEGGRMSGFFVLVLLLNIPTCIRAISALVNPLQVDPSGARFAGRYRRWQVNTLTGRVAGANTYTTTSTRTTYDGDGGRRVNVSSSVHNSLLLVDAAGQQHSLTLTNFGVEAWNGQIVTVCWAVRGRKKILFAVLNHSTRCQFAGTRWGCIDRIAVPRVGFATFWAIVSAITLIGLIPALAWAVTLRRQMRRFVKTGITPLWTSTEAVAAALSPQRSPGTIAEPEPLSGPA